MLTAKNRCRGLVGIEANRSAVEDARFNAALNELHNAEFYVGRVEQLFKSVLDELETAPEISAIVNPSRNGLGTFGFRTFALPPSKTNLTKQKQLLICDFCFR